MWPIFLRPQNCKGRGNFERKHWAINFTPHQNWLLQFRRVTYKKKMVMCGKNTRGKGTEALVHNLISLSIKQTSKLVLTIAKRCRYNAPNPNSFKNQFDNCLMQSVIHIQSY